MVGEELERQSILDRPVFGMRGITWWTVAIVALIAFIMLTRLWDLGSRGYSHDESIHAWEAWKYVTGQGYRHDPTYHGPFLYHFTALIFALFGHNDVTARLSPAIFGIILTILPLFLRPWLGKKGVLGVILLMAVSPVMMTRSRFLRHDPYVAVFNLVLFIAILRYLSYRKTRDLYLIAAAVALGFTAKETTFITYFIYGTFLAGLLVWQWLSAPERSWHSLQSLPVFSLVVVMGTLMLPTAAPVVVRMLGGNPVDYSQQGIIFSGVVWLVVFAASVAIGVWWDWRTWLICAGIFYGIFIPLFTSMFTNGQGFATGMMGALGYWLSQQGVARGSQPWYYYFVHLFLYEFLPFFLSIGGVVAYVVRGDPLEESDGTHSEVTELPERPPSPFVPFLIYWFLLAFVMYSWAGEKMPWLTMHWALPLQLLAGWTLGQLLEADWRTIWAKRGWLLLISVPLFVYAVAKLLGTSAFTGTTTQELSRSMVWLTALIFAAILAVTIYRVARRLTNRNAWRMIGLGLVAFLLALTLRFAWMATFINASYATEFLFYAHGTPDTALVTEELKSMSHRLEGDLSMKVAYDDESSWPFVWYLRNFTNNQFFGKKPSGPLDAAVVLVGSPNEAAVKPLLGNKYYRRQYRLIWWPHQDWYKSMTLESLREALIDPEERAKFWDIVYYRKYENPTTAWYHVNNFAMYVRRDIAQQLWDYGPEAVAAAGTMPGDEYLEKWQPTTASAAWGSLGSEPGQLRAPKGVAVDADGNVYVADSQNHRIQVLDASGQFVRQWGGQGVAPGQFNEPWDVAIAPNGEVYVADTWNHRVQVFDQQGNFLRTWGSHMETDVAGPGDGFYGPRGIALAPDGTVYVTDTGNHRLVKYDAQGTKLTAVGGRGDGAGQMQEPVGVAVSSSGEVYVVDTWNQRVQVFGSDLAPAREWQVYAWEGVSVVNKPYVAIDNQENVYVTDPEQYRIIQFDSQGNLIKTWGQYGTDLSSTNLPTGIAVDGVNNRIIVGDSDNHRLLVFSLN